MLPDTSFYKQISYASFNTRFKAEVIDALILVVPFFMLLNKLGYIKGIITGIPTVSVYYILMETSLWQGTIGKIVLKIRVTSPDDNRISVKQAIVRFYAKTLSALTPGYFSMIRDAHAQTLHDKIARTVVRH